ncbi:HK97 family phage prohead protease [Fodinicurvata fenggangensis]|uniref:HK97 family phage prohead protease n=1 Tax=Fodinicurvata fenggangensis TaxID=1121830 RepID=UPI00138E31ED|nr:HK97 family phage prohead protease [Fodinicurvata fenggangensis]
MRHSAGAAGFDIVVEFAGAEVNPRAEQALRLVRAGFLQAVSVGFLPLKSHQEEAPGGRSVTVFDAVELLEVSLVPVPSNPQALALLRALAPTDSTGSNIQRTAREYSMTAETETRAPEGAGDRETADAAAEEAALTGAVRREVEALRGSLLAEMQAGAGPRDRRVSDLEARLGEAEARLADARESLRLQRAGPILPRDGAAGGDGVAGGSEAFRGIFLSDPGEVRARLAQLRSGEAATRAIDSSLFTGGGKLAAETADRFVDYLIEQQVALSRVQVRRMNSPEGHTDELTVTSRRLRRGSEGTAPTPADAVGVRRRGLSTVEVIWAEDVTLTFLEDNIEQQDAEQAIAGLLAKAFGNDVNDLAWNGAEAETGDPFRSINDGWIALAEADAAVNDLDLADVAHGIDGDSSARDVLALLLRQQPVRFRGRTDQAIFVPVAFAERYAEETASRQTALGDRVLVGGFPELRYFGIPVIPEPHLTGATGERIMMTPAGNLFFGIQRQMTVDGQWQPRRRVVEYTMTARTDYQYATGEAIVLAGNLPAHLA